jgi:hypothetical protein
MAQRTGLTEDAFMAASPKPIRLPCLLANVGARRRCRGFPSPRSRTRRAPFAMHRALPCRIRVVGHPHLEQVVTAHLQVGDDGDGALIDPSIPGAAREPPPVPATDHEARRLGILLAQPAPQAIPHIMIDAGEHLLGSVAVLVEASPTEQDRIEGVDDLLAGETRSENVR